MANNMMKRVVGKGTIPFCMVDGKSLTLTEGNTEMLRGRKTGGLYRLKGSVQIEGATIRHGSNGTIKKNGQEKQQLHKAMQSEHRGTRRIRNGTRAQGDALKYMQKSSQTQVVQLVQDIQREAQILKSCTAMSATTSKQVYFGLDLINGSDLSNCMHKG
ncbi:hypothetical protein Acr_21g0002650 [Actinidia rufa]|uniref:Uncharacterized protein n=1 Tax=Actinidia rufa TaxID=165716 RepID=A0A7J0GFT0_9ERIC|nr:hypothetical protein Acr_21g0002650 [Actinidia rufa]